MLQELFPLLLCLLTTLVGLPVDAQDQTAKPGLSPSEGWARVLQIRPGQKIKVEKTDGSTVVGSFSQADSESVTLRAGESRTTVIGRREVERIHRKSRTTGILLGALLGATGGAAVGGVGPKEGDESRAQYVGLGAVLGAGIGTGVGAVLGKDVAIYRRARAEQPSR